MSVGINLRASFIKKPQNIKSSNKVSLMAICMLAVNKAASLITGLMISGFSSKLFTANRIFSGTFLTYSGGIIITGTVVSPIICAV